jgi:drug/metabolite transporter (DMT)-like permease
LDKRPIIPHLEAVFAVFAWGASFIATKVALKDVSPITVVWLRFTIGLLIIGIVFMLDRRKFLPSWKILAYFAFLGFLGITFHQWLQSNGLVTAQASTTAWIVATIPIFMALLGWLFLQEKLDWLQSLGIILATIGVILVVTKGDLISLSLGRFGAPGDILILISALNWAAFSVLSRRGLLKYPPLQMMFYVMLFGWIFISMMFFNGPGLKEISQLSMIGWSSVGFLGVACSGLAYIFWYDALYKLPSSQVGAYLYLEPLIASIVAYIVLNERLVWASLLGGIIILIGVWLVNRNP